MSIETGHGFGMQNKDMMLVTETGCELLSDYTNTDQLIMVVVMADAPECLMNGLAIRDAGLL